MSATPSNLPRAIGRWDIVTTLALRSSSSIFLARAAVANPNKPNEPNGAASAVAIKQVEGNEKLLDVVRIVSGLRHSNIVSIREIGQQSDQNTIFFVMDYVMGESAASLLRELHSRGETLDFTLAAYVIAEVAGGLHAAHEAKLIHGALTPFDVFIGYDGTVRVLDVGTAGARVQKKNGSSHHYEAAAQEQATTTQEEVAARKRRRELEYASPERCKNEPLDRQSDIFSLGAMLWELTTGLAPFERVKEEDTILAICEATIVPPSSVLPGLPEELSKITMRALAREKDERYPTAAAFRTDLLNVVRKLSLGASSADNLARLMKRLFEERIEKKNELLRRVNVGEPIADIAPLRDLDEDPAIVEARERAHAAAEAAAAAAAAEAIAANAAASMAAEEAAAAAAATTTTTTTTTTTEPGGDDTIDLGTLLSKKLPFKQAVIFGLLLLSVIGAVVTFIVVFTRAPATSSTAAPSTATASSSIVVASAPTPAPPPTTTTTPVAAITSAEIPQTAPSPAGEVETVLKIETVPPRATIFVGGVKKGVSPLDVKVPKGNEPVLVEIRHPGYQTLREKVTPDVNQKLKLTLTGAPHRPASSTTGIERFD